MSVNKVYIAIGTNVGDWKNNFNQAIKLISKNAVITKAASTYLSHPYGYKNQSFFYNTVIKIETSLSVYDLFYQIEIIEKKLQKNKLIKNGPRKIDLDIIFFNHLILSSKKLTIPHYAMHQRDFVLLPLIEICPFYQHPKKRKTVSAIYNELENKYVFKIKQRKKESLIVY